MENCGETVFIAGAKEEDGKLLTSGGRVLGVTALGKNIQDARVNAYKAIERIDFNGIYFRNEIGN